MVIADELFGYIFASAPILQIFPTSSFRKRHRKSAGWNVCIDSIKWSLYGRLEKQLTRGVRVLFECDKNLNQLV